MRNSFPCFHSFQNLYSIANQRVNVCVCVCLHRYDDYDYGEVNQLLERDLKLYIKAVACFPDATKAPVCPRSMVPLKPSERVRGRSPLLRSSTLYPPHSRGALSKPLYVLLCLSDTRELADHGGPAAGRAAIRSESHHSVHDCLSVWERHEVRTLRRHRERDADAEVGRLWHFAKTQSAVVL